MNWNRWFRLVSYARSSLWVVPFVAIVLEQVVLRVVLRIDDWLGWTFYGAGVHGAETVLQTAITLTLRSSSSPSVPCSWRFRSQAGN